MNNERLVFPVGVSTPLDGHSFYENLQEETMNFDLNSLIFDRSFLFVQTLADGTLKLVRKSIKRRIFFEYFPFLGTF